ncbi:uncharacterized protein LOC141902273 [Tubulanus polymorphus]|uniref:uncharacterized protein LOC141902273 n=1 Tax=Tubulanus polymorphus TaxID=672921 RepID=UPI003DA2773E
MALDRRGNHQLSLKDALVLFKQTHGDKFSMNSWNQFLKSRDNSTNDVYFDELKLWLCAIPSSADHMITSNNEFLQEEKNITNRIRQRDLNDLQNFKKLQEDEHFITRQVKERNDLEDRMKREARRKLSRWENSGVNSVIYDDNIEYTDSELTKRPKDKTSVLRILDALDLKYDLLRKPLLWEVIKTAIGDVLWSSMNNAERLEKYNHLLIQEKQLRKLGTLNEEARDLYGSEVMLDYSLQAVMGEIYCDNDSIQKMMYDGKTVLTKQQFEKSLKDGNSAEQILIELHKRQKLEREYLLHEMKPNEQRKLETMIDFMIGEYSKLLRQHALIKDENLFKMAAIATSLSEHGSAVCHRIDRYKHEVLARERLTERTGRKYNADQFEEVPAPILNKSDDNFLELQIDIVHQMIKLHQLEREYMVDLLQGRESLNAHEFARKSTSEQRLTELNILRNQRTAWRESSSEKRESEKQLNIHMLRRAVALFCADKQEKLTLNEEASNELDVYSAVLADLQQKQDEHFTNTINDIRNMSMKELSNLRRHQHKSFTGTYLDNVTAVVLQTHVFTDEEKMYLMALNNKYDALREKLITSVLQHEHLNWKSLSISEQQKLVIRKKLEERQLYQEGKYVEMESIAGNVKDLLPNIRKLMGENRLEFTNRLKSSTEREEQEALKGNYVELQSEEPSWENFKSVNAFADLQYRYDMEQNALISWLRSPEIRQLETRSMEVMLLRLQMEWKAAETSGEFYESAAIRVGLLERINQINNNRKQKRQIDLAALRNKTWLQRFQEGTQYEKQTEEGSYPQEGDILGWNEAVILEMCKKHLDEREFLLRLLHDEGLLEVVEAAKGMSIEEQQKRLVVIQAKHRQLNLENTVAREENVTLVEEAAAIQIVLKTQQLIVENKSVPSHDDVIVAILTDLQDEQDIEISDIIQQIASMGEEKLIEKRREQINLRKWEACDNILSALTLYIGLADDNTLMKKLDEKYTALRELLMQTLLSKTTDWKNLKDSEKQKNLAFLKHRDRKLRSCGKISELKNLLNDDVELDEPLLVLLGYNKAVCKQKRQDKLKQMKKEGAIVDENALIVIDEDELKDVSSLVELAVRFQQEQNLLLAQMKGFDGCVFGEFERCRCLLELTSESNKASIHSNIYNTSLDLGLAERKFTKDKIALKNDERRQLNLAKNVIDFGFQRRALKSDDFKDKVVTSSNITELQEACLKLFEKCQSREVDYLCLFMATDDNERLSLWASSSTDLQLEDKLNELKRKRNSIINNGNNMKQNHEVIQEAISISSQMKLRDLNRRSTDNNLTKRDSFDALMIAVLELHRNKIIEFIDSLLSTSKENLIELQKSLIQERKSPKLDGIATVVFHTIIDDNLTEEEAIARAVTGKYDALKEKLLIEALMKQHGEAEWKRMSDLERQKKIMEMKLKEKQLRKEGKLDELNALMDEAMKDQTVLNELMKLNKQEQERKLKERLEKRKLRLASGMTEDECDKLEIEETEEEEKQRRRNILDDLDKRCDEERDELLRQLLDQDGKYSSEKQRQAALAWLRMEQRKLLQEDQLDTAVLLMANMRDTDNSREADRLRQEQLARQRLAARQKQQREKRTTMETVSISDVDDSDIVGLQEALLAEIEQKHLEERDFFLKLLTDVTNDKEKFGKGMNEDLRQDRLFELEQYHKLWLQDVSQDPKEQLLLFKEAATLQIQSKQEKQISSDSKGLTDEQLQVEFLVRLQEQQDLEICNVMDNLSSQTPNLLRELASAQTISRQNQWNTNIAAVIVKSEGRKVNESEESLTDEQQHVVKALEEKYDAMKDKILMEALMQQAGDTEWNRLSEKERQARLIKLKLEEKKLRHEGREDEAVSLISNMLQNERAMNDLLGSTKSDQKMNLEERLNRLKELKAERETAGLSIDEEILNELIETEENEKLKPKNILENLQFHFEDEKAALLASLNAQTDKLAADRERQLAMAKLRRDQKRIQLEDRVESAAVLIAEYHNIEENREKGLVAERERQRALAKERLEAHKLRRQQIQQQEEEKIQKNNMTEEMSKLEAAQNKMKNLLLASTSLMLNGSKALSEDILDEVDKRHRKERNTLIRIIDSLNKEVNLLSDAALLDIEDVKVNLEKLRQEHSKWRTAVDVIDSGTDESRMKNIDEQIDILKQALVFRVTAESKRQGKSSDELYVALLADLQGKQEAEYMVMSRVTEDQEEKILEKLKLNQQQMIKDGLLDNVAKTIFTMLEDDASLPDFDAAETEFELQLEKEREAALADGQNKNQNVDEILAELNSQQELKRQAFLQSKIDQKYKALAELENKRLARDLQEYENIASMQILKLCEENEQQVLCSNTEQQSKQSSLLEQRLAARRQQRRKHDDERKLNEQLENDSSSAGGTPGGTPSSLRDIDSPMGLQREKTAITGLDLDEEKSKEVYTRLMGEQTRLHNKKYREQERQEKKLQEAIERRKQKRETDAVDVILKGEHAKNILEQTQKDERERQMTMIKNRVTRVRYERTMTMKAKSAQIAQQFDYIIDTDSSNMTQDEKMARAAKLMESKFRQEAEDVKEGKKEMVLASDEEEEIPLMSEKIRSDRNIKQRREERRQKRDTENK